MVHLLTLQDVKNMLESEHIPYKCRSFDYGFRIEYKNTEGISVKYYFNQRGDYIYPTKENLPALGKKIRSKD